MGIFNLVEVFPKGNKESSRSIDTIQSFYEDSSTVALKCAEYISEFVRGFVCDILVVMSAVDANQIRTETETIRDLVLVYIEKEYDGSIPEFTYIFYK